MREPLNEMPGFVWFGFIWEPAAGNQESPNFFWLSAGFRFLFLMDPLQEIGTSKVMDEKKNFLGVLEKTQEPLKCFVHSEPEHIWGCESKGRNRVQAVPLEFR